MVRLVVAGFAGFSLVPPYSARAGIRTLQVKPRKTRTPSSKLLNGRGRKTGKDQLRGTLHEG